MELQKVFAKISLKALTHNLKTIRDKTGGRPVLAVVKANAYGHGAVRVSKHLTKNGVSGLGVAFTHEGIALRETGIKTPILVFFDRNNADDCLRYNLTPVLFDYKNAKSLADAARRQDRRIPVHVKVDTGMGRIGFDVKKAKTEIPRIARLKNLEIRGMMSHFSDADLVDKNFANFQLNSFTALAGTLKRKGIRFKYLHMANSAAVLSMPNAHLDMVRPGLMLYGYGCCESEKLRPAMSLRSKIVFLKTVPAGTSISYGRTFITKRKSTIATIPVGYADGYSRMLSNNGEVLIRGKRAPVVGRVCMDTVMVDVTDIPGVTYASEAVLIGSQGKDRITADDIANKTGTIPYEVLTSVGQRVRRVYTTK